MWLLLASAIAGPADCGDPSAVLATVSSVSAGPVARQSAAAWADTLRATCAWAGELAPESDRACVAAACVRTVAEDRLATASSTAVPARAADLLHTTGRSCPPDDGRSCAAGAAAAEDARLARLMAAVDRAGIPALEAERSWFVYRDTACAAEALHAGDRAEWARAACGAVLAARRTERIAALVRLARPEAAARVDRDRYEAAVRALRPRGRPWAAWLRQTAAGDEVRSLLREAAEARADGAWFPPLTETRAFRACAAPDEACWRAVRAEIPRPPAAAPEPVAEAEQAWRDGWCRRLDGARRAACEAEVDWIAAAWYRTSAAEGGTDG